MRRGLRLATVVLALLAVLVALAGCGATGVPEPAPSAGGSASAAVWPEPAGGDVPAAVAEALHDTLAAWVAEHAAPGATAALASAEYSWSGATGTDGTGTPLQPASAGSIVSVTKTFVAAEVMLLARRGAVDLDAPISRSLPLPFDARGATVRQVLGMRGGLPPYPVEQLLPRLTADLDRVWTPEEVLALAAGSAQRQGEVGGPPDYNNLAYVALGWLVERVTGESLAATLRRDLLLPAGLERVWVQPAERPVAPLAVAAAPPDLPLVDKSGPYLPSAALASAMGGGACVAADAPSLARWGYLLYGGQAVGTAAIQQMTAGGATYGLGTVVGGEELGPGAVGHLGEDGISIAVLVSLPETRTSVAVLVPAAPVRAAAVAALARELHDIVEGTQSSTSTATSG